MKTAAPMTQTKGEVYQPDSEEAVKDFVVVVVELEPDPELEPEPSVCARSTVWIRVIINKVSSDLNVSPFVSCFMVDFFVNN